MRIEKCLRFKANYFLTLKFRNMKVSKNLDAFLQSAEVLVDGELSTVKGGSDIAIVFPVAEVPFGWWDETEG